MPWFKIFGACFLFFAVGALSLSGKKEDALRLLRLESQMRFVRFVRDRIDRYLEPISEILRESDEEMLSGVIIGCAGGFTDINSLRSLLRGGDFFGDGGAVFDSFLAALGSSYREGELAGCDSCIKDLTAIADKLSAELPRERKSKTVLGFCLAAAMVIILI